jgi:hypothetical protein
MVENLITYAHSLIEYILQCNTFFPVKWLFTPIPKSMVL